jgi:rhodanese-related sulfurtransferase
VSIALEILPREIQAKREQGEKLILIDVREPQEYAIARIEGAELIPMGSVPTALTHLEGLSDDGTLIVYCHHGMRSLSVVNWLRQQGLEACQSMAGGIDRWSLEIDPGVARY